MKAAGSPAQPPQPKALSPGHTQPASQSPADLPHRDSLAGQHDSEPRPTLAGPRFSSAPPTAVPPARQLMPPAPVRRPIPPVPPPRCPPGRRLAHAILSPRKAAPARVRIQHVLAPSRKQASRASLNSHIRSNRVHGVADLRARMRVVCSQYCLDPPVDQDQSLAISGPHSPWHLCYSSRTQPSRLRARNSAFISFICTLYWLRRGYTTSKRALKHQRRRGTALAKQQKAAKTITKKN